ncbi:MAG TPA: POTRA domain-containing protein [Verrucomicrobiota bacterium]|nr:POTRA domain-containing protein [Verrucomicrobiota bacterium]
MECDYASAGRAVAGFCFLAKACFWLFLCALPALGNAPAPSAPQATFRIERFEVEGGPVLDPPTVNEAMAEAVGERVSLPQIRAALVRLQRAYKAAGHTNLTVSLPRQELRSGTVTVRVNQSPASGASPGPTFDIRRFELKGNTVLAPEVADSILQRAVGPAVTPDELTQTLRQLQQAYRDRGHPSVVIEAPRQIVSGGLVTIEVRENLLAARAPKPAALEATSPPKPATFEVRHYEILGNSLLSPEFIDSILTNATGAEVTLPQIQKALGELQLAYRERGYATVSVGLPQQQLTNAVVKVRVTEGLLVDVQISGNEYFSSNNVRRALPSLKTNEVLNSRIFQQELDLANQNRDRQIYPVLGPGPEPGTSALTLRVKDRLPLHGRFDLNNYSTPGTPDWRINTSANYNNLWQLEHQVGVSYGFSPQTYKNPLPQPDFLLNRPLVANFGAYYRMPFGPPASVAEQISGATQFGYDEATRQFRLPPSAGQSELTIYGSASSDDTGVQYGPAIVVVDQPDLRIVSQDTGRNDTDNAAVGGRVNFPRTMDQTSVLNFSAGPDFKYYSVESFNTNNFFFTETYTTPSGGTITTNWVESSPQPTRYNDVGYLPLSLAVDYSHRATNSVFTANATVSGNFVGNSADFRALAYSPDAQSEWGKFTTAVSWDRTFGKNWSLLARGNGQATTGPVINNEQFALGGIRSVRGYYDGDEYGDAGWFASVELRTPFLMEPVSIGNAEVPVWLRASVFMDVGQRFLYEAPDFVDAYNTLWGTGFGVSANINNRVDVRITVGWPLLDSVNSTAGTARTYFTLGGQF